MTVHVVKVPDIGEGIAQVELVAWHVQPGDSVAEDQALADVMTDKATVEIPSPVAGQVLQLGGEVGQVMAVGSDLIRIERDGLPAAAPGAQSPGAKAGSANVATAPAPKAQPGAVAPQARIVPAAPPAATPAAGPRSGSAPPALAPRASEGQGAAQAKRAASGKPIASPAVRARAWELGVDLAEVPPSGPAGRVLRSDVEAHASRVGRNAPPPAAARETARAPGTREIRILGLRRMIAQRMVESKRRIPHYTYVEEVDVTELETLRSRLNKKWGAVRGHLTLLPFLIQAIAQSVSEYPQVNARFDDEAGVLTQFDAVHVGIATQTDAGLMVPVLRDAQARDLWSSAAEVARLAEAARSGKAVREELTGSTITITSLGPLGGLVSTPVINHPEVAIIGVNRIALRPVILGGTVSARQLMNLSSSFDHRVVDGAYAAAFVQNVRGLLEHPATLFIP
jgi:2-oxoisovalerate dehydrogenase E2 component (dihydrolipoyl transacylase)